MFLVTKDWVACQYGDAVQGLEVGNAVLTRFKERSHDMGKRGIIDINVRVCDCIEKKIKDKL